MPRQKLYITTDGEMFADESTLQQKCVELFALMHPKKTKLFFSIPNGGKLGGKRVNGVNIQAVRMVREGLTAGAADTFISIARCNLHGLFIEVKTPVGTWGEEQKQFCQQVIAEGYGYAIIRRLDDFEALLVKYMAGAYQQMPFEMIDAISNKKKLAK